MTERKIVEEWELFGKSAVTTDYHYKMLLEEMMRNDPQIKLLHD